MTNTVKVNLDKTLAGVKVMGAVAGVLLTAFAAYASIDNRMDKLELDQATFKGVQDERTRNMAARIDDIYEIVMDWSPDGQTAKKE